MQQKSHQEEANIDALQRAFSLFHLLRVEERKREAASSSFEKRGIKLVLFQRVASVCKTLDAQVDRPGYWTIGRVAALIVGNHEILVSEEKDVKEAAAIADGKTSDSVYRWGKHVDPSSTLTFAGKCSLIEMLQQGHFEAHDAPLGGNLRYDQVVGAKADIFVSFAYSCDFLELVDAIERFFESSPDLDENNAYLWFDLFVNNQWTALDKPFSWWGTTFKEAVEEIGHTLVVMLPWEAPIPLTRVWCLFEIFYSAKLSIALSSTQEAAFQAMLLSDNSNSGMEAITTLLCKIDVEKARSWDPNDRERIFAVLMEKEDGCHRLNVNVSSKLRAWVEQQAKKLVLPKRTQGGVGRGEEEGGADRGEEDVEEDFEDVEENSEALGKLDRLARVYSSQGKLNEAIKAWMRVLRGNEILHGPYHLNTLVTMGNLAICFQHQGKFVEAETWFTRGLEGEERTLGLEHPNTLCTINNFGTLYVQQDKLEEAEYMFMRAFAGREKVLGVDHAHTLITISSLATVFKKQGKFIEAETWYSRALEAQERTLGLEHPNTLSTIYNFGALYAQQDKLEEAEYMFMRAFAGFEKVLGVDHANTITCAGNLAFLRQKQK